MAGLERGPWNLFQLIGRLGETPCLGATYETAIHGSLHSLTALSLSAIEYQRQRWTSATTEIVSTSPLRHSPNPRCMTMRYQKLIGTVEMGATPIRYRDQILINENKLTHNFRKFFIFQKYARMALKKPAP